MIWYVYVLLEICDLFEYSKIVLNLLAYPLLLVFVYLLSIIVCYTGADSIAEELMDDLLDWADFF